MFGIFYFISELISRILIRSEENSQTRFSYEQAVLKNRDTYYDSHNKCFRTTDTHEECVTWYDEDKNGRVLLVNPNTLKVIRVHQTRKPKKDIWEEVDFEAMNARIKELRSKSNEQREKKENTNITE